MVCRSRMLLRLFSFRMSRTVSLTDSTATVRSFCLFLYYPLLFNSHITDIGEEAIHVKINSTHNIVQNNLVQNTGLNPGRGGFGEGIYIGTSVNNGVNDFSDYNTLRYNWLGPNVTAEGMDIKEFTTGTINYKKIYINNSNCEQEPGSTTIPSTVLDSLVLTPHTQFVPSRVTMRSFRTTACTTISYTLSSYLLYAFFNYL
jgi:hypothetical protein